MMLVHEELLRCRSYVRTCGGRARYTVMIIKIDSYGCIKIILVSSSAIMQCSG